MKRLFGLFLLANLTLISIDSSSLPSAVGHSGRRIDTLFSANRPSGASDPQADESFETIRNKFEALLASGGQYMVQQCVDVNTTDPALLSILKPYLDHANSANFKLKDCKYSSEGRKGRVILLNVDADRLARWAISACKATNQGATARCLTAVLNDLWCPSNAQFPVSGTVVEPADICDPGSSGSALFAFRDGVTVKLRSFKPPNGATCVKQQLTETQLAAVLSEAALKSKLYARVANASPDIVVSSGVTPDKVVLTPVEGKIPYLETVRSEYLNALGSDNYAFLSAWAIRNEQAGFFKRFKNMPLGKLKCGCFYADTQGQINNRCQ